MLITHEIRHAHLFCGLGGGARGFNAANPRVGSMQGTFRCLGGIDVDPASIRDFERLTGVPGTVMDLFSREQYRAFHGQEPPEGWREAMPADIHATFGHERPHIVFLSAPCKGFSGLLSQGKSQSAKYQALNGLTLRGVWLTLEAYADNPAELLVFENVPRIATRGRHLLDQITALLRSYGYAVAETTHDCGQIGGLAQSRKRFLLVARHMERVPSFLYQPDKKPLRAVGDVLGRMPLPGDPAGGPMHRIPALQWKTWVRLAFVEAGSDWRSLNRLAVEDGMLRDYGIMPEKVWQDGALGVLEWARSAGTVTGKAGVTTGRFAVADPRTGWSQSAHQNLYRIVAWDGIAHTITGATHPAGSALSVADPRVEDVRRNGFLGVTAFDEASGTVAGRSHAQNGKFNVADPRCCGHHEYGQYGVMGWKDTCRTVTAQSAPGGGRFAIADPRCHGWDQQLTGHSRQGVYGVNLWNAPGCAVTAHGRIDNSTCAVADPRLPELPSPTANCVAIIRALDGTWHRPFTTLELAALQGLLDPEDTLELEGLSDSAWRERIGNAVPPPAARAVAEVMGQVLLLTWAGETFTMSQNPIWVRPITAALMSAQGRPA